MLRLSAPLREPLRSIFALALAACACWLVARHLNATQWDFKVYYAAALCDAHGYDPYVVANFGRVIAHPPDQPFVYPPITLYFFRAFTWFDLATASALWLSLKLAAMLGLLVSWQRLFFRGQTGLLFYAFCLTTFSASGVRDLISGNVSAFEQCLLWYAIYLFIHDESAVEFCALVCVAALFKLLPIVFLGLWLTTNRPHRIRSVAIAASAWAVAVFTPLALHPERARTWLANLSERGAEGGAINPTLLAFIKDAATPITAEPLQPTAAPVVVTTALLSFVVVGLSVFAWRRARGRLGAEARTVLVLLCTLCYALVLPRFKDYSFTLLVPALYYLLTRLAPRSGWIGASIVVELIGAGVCPVYRPKSWPSDRLVRFLFCDYRALVLLCATWLTFVVWLLARGSGRGRSVQDALAPTAERVAGRV